MNGQEVPIGKGLFTVYLPDTPNQVIYKKGDKILFYYGEKLSEREYQQRYGVFTAPYAIGSRMRPDAPVVDAALFRTIAALANHKPPSQCNTIFEAAYPTSERTGRFRYAIVAKKISEVDKKFMLIMEELTKCMVEDQQIIQHNPKERKNQHGILNICIRYQCQ